MVKRLYKREFMNHFYAKYILLCGTKNEINHRMLLPITRRIVTDKNTKYIVSKKEILHLKN